MSALQMLHYIISDPKRRLLKGISQYARRYDHRGLAMLIAKAPLKRHDKPTAGSVPVPAPSDSERPEVDQLPLARTFCTRIHAAKLLPRLVAVEESRRFMYDCLCAVGVPSTHAGAMADTMIGADIRGCQSHGMHLLAIYVNDVLKKVADGGAVPKIIKQSSTTAWVDGCNGLGMVIGNFCMDLAITKAKNVGVGWVCAKNSNHFGLTSWYPLRAMESGCVGIAMSNASRLRSQARTKSSMLAPSPLACGASGQNDQFLSSMATTMAAMSQIQMLHHKGDAAIPNGWAQGLDAKPALESSVGWPMPLHGSEESDEYKGTGLTTLVDVLSGILGDANYSNLLRWWGTPEKANLGQVFIAVNPNSFSPACKGDVADFLNRLRSNYPFNPQEPVLVAGDVEKMSMNAVTEAGGIHYLPDQINACEDMAKKLHIKPLAYK